jgi:hypothetical protein
MPAISGVCGLVWSVRGFGAALAASDKAPSGSREAGCVAVAGAVTATTAALELLPVVLSEVDAFNGVEAKGLLAG